MTDNVDVLTVRTITKQSRGPTRPSAREEHAFLAHLERLRWHGEPFCGHCRSPNVSRHRDRARPHLWQCRSCRRTFTVRTGTIFAGSKLDLLRWYVLIIITAKPSGPRIGSIRAARMLDMSQQTAYAIMRRIRQATGEDAALIAGIAASSTMTISTESPEGAKHGRWTAPVVTLAA
jgi:transposase-like protein